jgi:hypothetical protein
MRLQLAKNGRVLSTGNSIQKFELRLEANEMHEAYLRGSVIATSLCLSMAGVRVCHNIRLEYIITSEMSWSRTAG